MPTEEATSYGAIPRGDAEDNADFDETNLSYLKQSSFSWNRFCRATVPIIIALLIMGGFAFGMGHGFGNLYGPPKSSGDNSIKNKENWYSSDDTSSSASIASNSAATKSSAGAECAANSKCNALGLIGDCCPHDGVMLGCCD
ncbi:hypothetical protein ACHAXM_011985 [Skeletonema potamos]